MSLPDGPHRFQQPQHLFGSHARLSKTGILACPHTLTPARGQPERLSYARVAYRRAATLSRNGRTDKLARFGSPAGAERRLPHPRSLPALTAVRLARLTKLCQR